MIALVPLAIAPGLLSAFDITPKITILLVCVSVLLFFCKKFVNGPSRLFVACLAFQWLSSAASTIWSSSPGLSLAGSSWRGEGLIAESAILLFALIAAAWFAEDPLRIHTVLRVAIITGIVASLYGIAQYFGWDPFLPSKAYQAGEDWYTIVRPPATFGHADYFANWLVIVAFLALALKEPIAKAAFALMAFAIVLSGTRSAMLGLLIGAIVFVVIARPRLDKKVMLTLAASLACLVGFYVSPAGAKLRARVHWSREDASGGARLLLWRDTFHMAMHHPILGYGPETFTAQFPPFASAELSRAYPDFYQESPHNMFLDALVSRGIPGALAILAITALALWSARKNPALAASLTGALVCQQFMVLTIPTALYFYLLIAIIVGCSARVHLDRPVDVPFWLPIPLAATFLLFAARLLLTDHAMALAERSIESGNVPAAASAYETVRRWEPSRGDSDLRYSRGMMHLATTTKNFGTSAAAAQQATESAILATETAEDRQNAWYNLATIAALRNDSAGVENGLRRAIESAPNWFKPHWTLAQFLELTGRHAEARREAAIALELNGGHDAEVTVTSQKILSIP